MVNALQAVADLKADGLDLSACGICTVMGSTPQPELGITTTPVHQTTIEAGSTIVMIVRMGGQTMWSRMGLEAIRR